MKRFILPLVALCFASCSDREVASSAIDLYHEYKDTTIDGCEYILAAGPCTCSFSFTHKGNCKNHPAATVYYDGEGNALTDSAVRRIVRANYVHE